MLAAASVAGGVVGGRGRPAWHLVDLHVGERGCGGPGRRGWSSRPRGVAADRASGTDVRAGADSVSSLWRGTVWVALLLRVGSCVWVLGGAPVMLPGCLIPRPSRMVQPHPPTGVGWGCSGECAAVGGVARDALGLLESGALVHEYGAEVAAGLAPVAVILDPEIVVLSGPFCGAGGEVERNLRDFLPSVPRVLLSRLGEQAVAPWRPPRRVQPRPGPLAVRAVLGAVTGSVLPQRRFRSPRPLAPWVRPPWVLAPGGGLRAM